MRDDRSGQEQVVVECRGDRTHQDRTPQEELEHSVVEGLDEPASHGLRRGQVRVVPDGGDHGRDDPDAPVDGHLRAVAHEELLVSVARASLSSDHEAAHGPLEGNDEPHGHADLHPSHQSSTWMSISF